MTLVVDAQIISGYVIDAVTGEKIPHATVVYRSHHVQAVADMDGKFTIQRHNGWTLFFSSLGYKTEQVKVTQNTNEVLTIRLRPDTKQLNEVVVNSKKSKYSRKNNPAVELMKRVIAAKKKTDLSNNNFYEFYKYQKLTLARNNVSTNELAEMKVKGNKDWMINQVELCPMNGKMILPLQVTETVSRKVYRKNPHAEKLYVLGESSNGLANLVETAGSILEATMKDVFTDIDIYEDQIRLLKLMFTSPISKDAISFYRFYIADTLKVGGDECIHLQFTPNNQQDVGFNGDIYVLNDSTLHVRRIELSIPKKSEVNFVENMKIEQEFVRLPDGQWVQDTDNMMAEMRINRMLNNAVVIRSTKLSDYSFKDIPKVAFRGKAQTVVDADSKQQGRDFWQKFRTVELTKSESSMGSFVDRITRMNGMKYILFGLRAFMNNYVGTSLNDSVKSKFDFGPVNTIINRNIVDGYRFRLSGRTTASLNPHLFWEGYVARGMSSHKWYYSTLFTYAFNRKNNEPWEFPVREISFLSEHDIISPSDKFLSTNKDNLFTAFHVKKVDKMYFYNRQKLQFKYETLGGLATTLGIKTEAIEGAAMMKFQNLDGTPHDSEIRTTELSLHFRYAPGESFINTKQHRYPINRDNPVYTISHTVGVNGLLGGKYKVNYTEASIYKRFWLKSWGKLDIYVSGSAQWNTVPFPLLIMPHTNLSYISQHNTYTFQLMNNLEFLSDRQAMWHMTWNLNGKLFNRIPLLKALKWREKIGFRGMVSTLTDKNNPFLEQNAGNSKLLMFPEGCQVMGKRPYMEVLIGVHNIFKFLELDYVRRLSYNDLSTAMKHGVRFALNLTF